MSNHKYFRFEVLIILIFFFINIGFTQSQYHIVKEISIAGNGHTKEYIIHKVIDISINDHISKEEKKSVFNKNENLLYDTKLFNKVVISEQIIGPDSINIFIYLEPSWYIFPSPILEIAAENFNAWWKTYHFSSKWINYGLRLKHENLTGNKDALKLVYQSGFTEKYELDYNIPYFFKSDIGFSVNAYYTTNKSAGYATIDNKVKYHEDKIKIILTRFRLDGTLYHRPNPFLFHLIKLQYHHNSIDQSISELNQDYFLDSKVDLRYLLLEYHIKYDKRVFKLYPEGGYMAYASIRKEGLGVYDDLNLMHIQVGLEQYFRMNWGLLLQFGIEFKKQFIRKKIPYSNYSAIGYGNDFLRGYDSYIIDGADYIISRSSIRKNIVNRTINFGKWMPLRSYKKMETELFLRLNFEMGYVNDPYYALTNNYNNRLLIGIGTALDMIIYHNHLFSVEYNFNIEGDHSVYLHNNITF